MRCCWGELLEDNDKLIMSLMPVSFSVEDIWELEIGLWPMILWEMGMCVGPMWGLSRWKEWLVGTGAQHVREE